MEKMTKHEWTINMRKMINFIKNQGEEIRLKLSEVSLPSG